MSRWSAGSVQTNGISMHYYRTGAGKSGNKPPLVLAHGLTDNGLCWKPIAKVLAETYDCIMPDARGHGFSSAPETGYTNKEHAADYAGLIEALGLDKPAILGHSMGGGTATQLAVDFPQLIRGAVLEDPPWRDRAQTADRSHAHMEWRDYILENKQRSVIELLKLRRAERANWPDAEFDGWCLAKQQVDINAAQYATISSNLWWEMVPQLVSPTLLICADVEMGALISPTTAKQAAALSDRMQVAHIPGAGHNIRREQATQYLEVVQQFLATLY